MATSAACPKCRTAAPPSRPTCLRCGHTRDTATPISPSSADRNDQDARFCSNCGHPLAVLAAQPYAPAAPIDTTDVFVDYRTHRVPVVIGLLVFLVLVVLIVGLKAVERSCCQPESTVARLFDALRDRDATGARALLLPVYDLGDPALLQERVLRSPGYTPPTDVHVEEASEVPSGDGEVWVDVRASFMLDRQKHWMSLRLRRDDHLTAGLFRLWRIEGGLDQITVAAPGADSVVVAGTNVPFVDGSSRTLTAYPGGYRVSLPDQPLWEADPVMAYAGVTDSEYAGGQAALEPTIKGSARASIDQQVRSLVDGCAQRSTLAPENCPFSASSLSSVTDVRWKIVRYPEYEVSRGDSGAVEVRTTGPGEADVTGRAKYSFSGETYSYSYRSDIYLSGSVVVSDGAIRFEPQQE
ncbi:hypothetical protein [Microbispora sp. CA-102843]|uniref:hypothetical protein n=1 Tax=Microbispora sp. CA-102843 TaxID=3239952 RepID=UPI003D938837